MKRLKRRDKMKIYADILSIVQSETKKEKIVLTRIQQKTNVPFDRLKVYISEMKELGLVQNDFLLTEKGRQYLIEYNRVLDFMKRMGLEYPE